MVKEMRSDWNPRVLPKNHNVFVKFAVSILLVCLAFRLFSNSISFSSIAETPLLDRTVVTETAIPVKTSAPVATPEIVDHIPSSKGTRRTPARVASPEIVDHIPSSEGTRRTPARVASPEIADHIPSSKGTLSTPARVASPEIVDHVPSSKEKCDIFTGDWIPDPSGPIYTNETCHFIEDDQNCKKNGRPDSGYLYWRWNPRDCDLPPFSAERFLELMRHKSWALIGDSISRNYVQSLLCVLSKVEKPVEVYHDKEYKSRRWHFPSSNFTISMIWSPFLLQAAIFENKDGVATSEIELYLDKLDKKWTDQYQSFDYMIISGGKWFLKTAIYYENDTIVGCHYCPGKNLTEMGFEYGYRKALQLVLNFIVTSNHKGLVLFRTSTPDHFENGEWFSGGTCNRTKPFKEGEIDMSDVDVVFRNIEVEEYEKAAAALGSDNELKLKFMDTSRLSLLRPDGHPGPYRYPHPFAAGKGAKVVNDCLHWCLPGPIDAWNDLVMELVVNG